jgi:hypothetical protein
MEKKGEDKSGESKEEAKLRLEADQYGMQD